MWAAARPPHTPGRQFSEEARRNEQMAGTGGARGGRLPDAIDAAMERLNTSVDIDWELWREDIAGSVAHAEGLARAGVLNGDEALAIVTGLQQIKGEIERG